MVIYTDWDIRNVWNSTHYVIDEVSRVVLMRNTSAEELAYNTCVWVKNNQPSFKAIMRIMHFCQDNDMVLRRDDLYAYALQNHIDISICEQFRQDHDLWSGITRYAVMLRPSLCGAVRFRKSKLDEIDLVATWHDVVNAGTFFFASSVQDAIAKSAYPEFSHVG